jgi:hypothetical protein
LTFCLPFINAPFAWRRVDVEFEFIAPLTTCRYLAHLQHVRFGVKLMSPMRDHGHY